jgi:hypothetical protein
MRTLALAGIIIASAALVACQADNPPRSAVIPDPAIVQDAQSAPSAPTVAMATPSVAELPPGNAAALAPLDANGPPLNILKPPR